MKPFQAYETGGPPRSRGTKQGALADMGIAVVVACFLLLCACGLFAQTKAPAGSMGPLRVDPKNSHYFIRPDGHVVFLTGSQTWNVFQGMGTSIAPNPTDLHAFIRFLKAHGHNVTILWKKDLPIDCGWRAGGIWYIAPFPFQRTGGPGGKQRARDGLPAFDLSQYNHAYFDSLRRRALELQRNGIYAIVQLFDGLQLIDSRCRNDGYPFTAGNNVNGADDGRFAGRVPHGVIGDHGMESLSFKT